MICCIYAITHAAEVSRRSAHAIVANAAAAVMVLWPVALATDLENIRGAENMICCIYAITHAAEVSRRSAHAIVANAAAAVMVLWPVALATDLENIRGPKI